MWKPGSILTFLAVALLSTLPTTVTAQDPSFHRGPYLQLLQSRSVYVV
jgi:hypothetical protein